ncbi:MAG: zf-HC2 domain-containing protein [Ignavibacteriales bacterium]|nr:zf-HC2 domain-containing protein [Ignavibacteriales bacterium]
MMTCEQSRELFIEALYDELPIDVKREFDQHLVSCAKCATDFQNMKTTLKIMDQRSRTEPDQAYWNSYCDRLSSKIAEERDPSKKFTWRPARLPAWAYGIAAMFLIAMGIYLGRTYFGQHELSQPEIEHPIATNPVPLIEDSTTTQALVYLERSKNLLIGFANRSEDESTSRDLSHQQEVSRRLIQQASMLKTALNKPDQQLMRQLILDLEVILLQLANIEVKRGIPAVELVKKGIDQKSILLKINLEEMRAMARRPSASSDKKIRTTL